MNIDIGTKISVLNEIDGTYDYGTIVFIEMDDEEQGLAWFYIKSDNPLLNTNSDIKFKEEYWRIIESVSNLLKI